MRTEVIKFEDAPPCLHVSHDKTGYYATITPDEIYTPNNQLDDIIKKL